MEYNVLLLKIRRHGLTPDVWSLIIFLTISLVFSFICSVLEAVLLSITPSFVASHEGKLGDRLKELKRDIDKPLAAILTLNTFAHTIGATGVGAAAQNIWGETYLTLVSAVVTVVILIGSEIIPKTIGAVYWQQLAGTVSHVCKWLTWILYPFVVVCQLITRMFRSGGHKSILSRESVKQVVAFGYVDGLIQEHEKDIIENLLSKEKLSTSEIMTPRERLVALSDKTTMSALKPGAKAWHLSRIPVYSGDENNIVGYVLKDEVLVKQLSGLKDRTLSGIVRDIVVIEPETPLKDLYHQLITSDEHIAIVKDSEKVWGVVTMEDVLEEVLGQEIVDESDRARGVLD